MIDRLFLKVYPYEYQRALKQLEDVGESTEIVNGNSEMSAGEVKDIEDVVTDVDMEQRKLDKIRCRRNTRI